MPLIQDIVPRGGRRDRSLQTAVKTAKRVHSATQLSRLQRPRADVPIIRLPIDDLSKPDPRNGTWERFSNFIQYPLIALLAIGSAYNSNFGQLAVGVYFIVALLLKLGSRVSFAAAILLLIAIPGFQVINLTGVSQKVAIYAYELLVVGTLQSIIELYLENRRNNVVNPLRSRR